MSEAKRVTLADDSADNRHRKGLGMETYLVPMWVVECGVQRDGCISMVKAADAQATVEALQRERDTLREATKVICGHCCEPMAIPSKAILQSQLSALQALVRAAVSAPGKDWLEWQLKLGEALDATTPATKGGDGE